MGDDEESQPTQRKKRKLEIRNETTMDVFPLELVGKILSQLVKARDVAVASATCHKWQEAAQKYIQKLSFHDSDWPTVIETWKHNNEALWSVRELIIAETVMRTTCLKELSICCDCVEGDKSRMHAGMLMACLLHVLPMLKSLTLTSPLMPNVNMLERLASGASVLEHLEWHNAYMPTLGTSNNGFPSLVSLALDKVSNGSSAQSLMLIFSSFPKLEHLSVKNWHVADAPAAMELNICSLMSLKMESIIIKPPSTFSLYDDKLGRLCVKRMQFGYLHWMRREGSDSMQYLRLRGLWLEGFEVGECLGHLEVKDVEMPLLELKDNLQHLTIGDSSIRQLKMENLSSLIALELVSYEDFEKAWWRTYSPIVSKAGSRLQKLTIGGSSLDKGLISADAFCLAFPCLQTLSVNYPNVYHDESTAELLLFDEIRHLELHMAMLPEDCIPFTQWYIRFLRRCPNLKSVVIMLDMALTTEPFENYDFIGELFSLLVPIMHPYPHVQVNFDFSS